MEGQMEPQSPQAPQGETAGPDEKKMKKELNMMAGGISKILHGKNTKAKIYEMLKAAPAEKSIPEAAVHANMLMIEKMTQSGKKPSQEVILGGVIFATSELAEIGNAGGFFEKNLDEASIKPVLQNTLQKMLVDGVKKDLIDPVEFQEKIEPMLSDQQRQMGLQAGQRAGIPAQAGTGQAMERYADQKVSQDRAVTSKRMAAKSGAMQQAAQGGRQ